jgi:hypothetical protein
MTATRRTLVHTEIMPIRLGKVDATGRVNKRRTHGLRTEQEPVPLPESMRELIGH